MLILEKLLTPLYHVILLDRFRELGVHSVLISWLHSFLHVHQRRQRVQIWKRIIIVFDIVVDYEKCSSTGFMAWSSVLHSIHKQNRSRRWKCVSIYKDINDITIAEQIKHRKVYTWLYCCYGLFCSPKLF